MPPQCAMADTSQESIEMEEEEEAQAQIQDDEYDEDALKLRMTMTDPHPWSAIRWYVGSAWIDIMEKNPQYNPEVSFHRIQHEAERRWLTLDDDRKHPFHKLEKKDRKKLRKGFVFKTAEEVLERIRRGSSEGDAVDGIRRLTANQSMEESTLTADEATPRPSKKKHSAPAESGESANEFTPKAKKQKTIADQKSVDSTPKSAKKKSQEESPFVANGPTTPKTAKKSSEEEEKFEPKSAKKSPRKKKSKDPNRPKKPVPAFMRYMNSVREKIKEANPDFSTTDIGREAGRRWKEMSEEDKAPFQKAYEEEKEEFKKNQANN